MARQFPKVESVDPTLARLLNLIFRELERWSKLQVAGGTFDDGNPPTIRVGGAKAPGDWVQSPGGGIAALSGTTPGSGTCTRYIWDGTNFSLGSDTVTVKNAYGTAVGGTKKVKIGFWQGDWWAENWEC